MTGVNLDGDAEVTKDAWHEMIRLACWCMCSLSRNDRQAGRPPIAFVEMDES